MYKRQRQQQFIQFAYSYVRDKEEAEDIVMGACTNVWEHRNELREDTNISALLLTAIKNRSLNHLQHWEVRMRAEQDVYKRQAHFARSIFAVFHREILSFRQAGTCFFFFCTVGKQVDGTLSLIHI